MMSDLDAEKRPSYVHAPRELKELLLKITALPKADQNWIFTKLPKTQMLLFKKYEGFSLLAAAKRFQKLSQKQLNFAAKNSSRAKNMVLVKQEQLAKIYQKLAAKTSLYIAIILEQAAYPWEQNFLQDLSLAQKIRLEREQQVPKIKAPVKEAIMQDWKAELALIDLCGNSATEENCFVAPVLESSCDSLYTPVLRSRAPRSSLSAVIFRRGLIAEESPLKEAQDG